MDDYFANLQDTINKRVALLPPSGGFSNVGII
jgi:hypothetical protein